LFIVDLFNVVSLIVVKACSRLLIKQTVQLTTTPQQNGRLKYGFFFVRNYKMYYFCAKIIER